MNKFINIRYNSILYAWMIYHVATRKRALSNANGKYNIGTIICSVMDINQEFKIYRVVA